MIKLKNQYKQGKFILWINLITFELYIPYIINTNVDKGFVANIKILLKTSNKYNEMFYKWAFMFQIFGFGLGVCYKHCDNPFINENNRSIISNE